MASRHKTRSYARNRARSRRGNEKIYELDSTFFVKLVLAMLVGTFWVKFASPLEFASLRFNALPIGTVVGIIVVSQFEPLQLNRKIWYTVLAVVTLVSYFLPAGIVL